MIAAFLGLRLYSVLGRRAEHEEEPVPHAVRSRRHARAARANRRSHAPAQPLRARSGSTASARPRSSAACARLPRPTAGSTSAGFLEGAKGAYAMVLEAFWRGDKES